MVTTRPGFGLAAAYIAVCIIWGSTYLAIKVGLASFDPFFFAGLRYLIAASIGYVLVRWRGVRFAGSLRQWIPAFGVGVLFVATCNGAVFWSETRLDSGFTALLITAAPLWTAALAPLTPGEGKLSAVAWGGVVAGFVGTVLLIEPWKAGHVELVAALVVEASAVVWAATSLWVRVIRERYHPFALTVAQMASGAVVLLSVAAVRGRALVGPLTLESVAALGFLVVFGSLVAFGSYFYLLRHWDASRVATSTYINPVVALALGASLLGEKVSWNMVVGVAVILAGVAVVLREQQAAAAH